MINKKYIRIIPLAFLSGVAFSFVSNGYAGNLSDRLELAEAKVNKIDCMSAERERKKYKEANEAVLREYFRRFGEIDIHGAAELWHEDIVLHLPTNPLSQKKIRGKDAVVEHYLKGFAAEAEGGGVEGSIKWLQHVQGQDAIVFEYHEKGTLKDGATFDLDALAFVRFKDGKMIYYEEWFDPMPFLKAIGSGLPAAESH